MNLHTNTKQANQHCSSSSPITIELLDELKDDSEWQNAKLTYYTGMFWWSIDIHPITGKKSIGQMYVPNDSRSWRQPKNRGELEALLRLTEIK